MRNASRWGKSLLACKDVSSVVSQLPWLVCSLPARDFLPDFGVTPPVFPWNLRRFFSPQSPPLPPPPDGQLV